jgi:exodeoxyribonuclease-3
MAAWQLASVFMRVVTCNVNGIRGAAGKGFFDWLSGQGADVICLQETKAQLSAAPADPFCLAGYHCHYHDAQKRGYSGVALYSRLAPDSVIAGLGWPEIDVEGRYLEARFGALSIASFYMPSGTSGEVRQDFKYAFMDKLMPWLKDLHGSGREYILCGDWNIAHKKIDLKNWRGNQKNSGFLPEERAWMDVLFDEARFVDAFRVVDNREEQYTWWSYRGQAWAKNVGWRIDYQVISPGLKDRVDRAHVYTEQRFSDHAPLLIDYDLTLPL